MLTADLGSLFRTGAQEIDAELDPARVEWDGVEERPAGPISVRLSLRPAGGAVVARGDVEGHVAGECRRCLKGVRVSVREPLELVFQRDADPDDPDAYPLPDRGAALDLWPAVREQWLLAMPAFLECETGCAGLCPQCGADLDEDPCECEADSTDARWGPLLALAGGAGGTMNDEVADGRSEEEGIEAEEA